MDSRRFLPHALVATAVVIVAPALVVIPLSPFAGIPDLVLSALLATGLSAAAGSVCSALWTRRPESREISFGDLLLWSWVRRVRAERRFARAVGASHHARHGQRTAGAEAGDALAALHRLSVVFEARDASTHGHTGRVARHAERIAERMGLAPSEVAKVKAAASVHDVGKVRLPRSVLVREGELTPEQQALVERHVVDGAEKVAAAGAPEIAEMVRHHHERVDGTGYPDGLSGDEIPLGARIIAVADAFDRLVAPVASRPRVARRENALDVLSERAGSQLDPAAVAAFVGYYSGTRAIAGMALAATAPQRLVRWVAAAPAGIGASAPPLAQGVCAAGALALAGSCLTTLPSPSSGSRDGGSPPARVERATTAAPSALPDRAAVALDRPSAAGERPRIRRDTAGGGGSGGGAPADGGAGTGGDGLRGGGGGQPPPSVPGDAGESPVSAPGGSTPGAAPDGAPAQQQPPPPPAKPPSTSGPGGVPQVEPPPAVPASPSLPILPPLLERVDEVLDPLPTEQLTDPLARLLGGGGSPP